MRYNDQTILIKDLKKGKEEAYIHLVETYSDKLFAYALTLSTNAAMAQDIVQNVFFKTWDRRKKMYINSSVQNYLLKSVRNEFLNLYKKKRSTMLLEQKYFESLERVTHTYDEKQLTKYFDRITKEIQNLPPKCREVFLLSRMDGLTNIEISDYLQVSIKTVEAHITKAFSLLREKLQKQFEPIFFVLFGKVS